MRMTKAERMAALGIQAAEVMACEQEAAQREARHASNMQEPRYRKHQIRVWAESLLETERRATAGRRQKPLEFENEYEDALAPHLVQAARRADRDFPLPEREANLI